MITSVTWGWNTGLGGYLTKEADKSLDILLEYKDISHIILAFAAYQETPFSTEVNFTSINTPSEDEIIHIIRKIKNKGKNVILKPTVNCLDGTWRAHINFFDIDVPCESKWSEWFDSYKKYIKHYANIAEQEECEILVVGCEMVQTERREKEWRDLVSCTREIFKGKISYNCDKYQEDNVNWWDCVDIISSSGYYPVGTWTENLKRIQEIVNKYDKPFMFMEVGCPSKEGNGKIPNKWDLEDKFDEIEQEIFYTEMFEQSLKSGFISGYGLWDWSVKIYDLKDSKSDCSYNFYGKKADQVIQNFFSKLNRKI